MGIILIIVGVACAIGCIYQIKQPKNAKKQKAFKIGIVVGCVITLMGYDLLTQKPEWYENGTLHEAASTEWKNAEYSNRLATASDWAYALINGRDERLFAQLQPEQFRQITENLVECIDGALPEETPFSPKDALAGCWVLMYNNK